MGYLVQKPAPDAEILSVSGAGVLSTNAPKIQIMDKGKSECVDLLTPGSVETRCFLVSLNAFLVFPAGSDYSFCSLDPNSKHFKFEEL